MSDLNFSSTELYQFSNRSGAIEIPGIADQEGGSLSGGISGSEVAESAYRNLQTSAEYYLDRAGRGLAAYQQLTAEIADTFVGQDRINAERLQDAWRTEYEPLRGNNRSDAPPQVGTTPAGSLLDVLFPQGR